MKIKTKIIPNNIKDAYLYSKSLLDSYFKNLKLIKSNFKLYKYKLNNLANTNFSLGVLHLQNGKINDAIFRFKIISKLFPWHISLVFHWLGWCYYFKSDLVQSMYYLRLSNEPISKELLEFLQNRETTNSIPVSIWNMQRELTAYSTTDITITNNFASSLIKLLIKSINDLPLEGKCLELGYINYNFAKELKRRLPNIIKLTMVESSEKIITDVKNNYSEYYDESILYKNLNNFLLTSTQKFHLIYSCIAISCFRELDELINNIATTLYPLGYFMLITHTDFNLKQQSNYSLHTKTYIYNHNYLKKLFNIYNFSIIYSGKLHLSNKENFSIIMGQKN